MSRRWTFRSVLAAAVAMLLIGWWLYRRDPLPARDSLAKEDIALMESLAARVPSPWKTGTWPSPKDVSDEDPSHKVFWQDQQRVEQVIERLRSRGTACFPAIVAYSRDERYSHSSAFSAWYNCSIGEVCIEILATEVDPDGRNFIPRRDYTYLEDLAYHRRLGAWWRDRSGRSLRELQIEAIEYYLARARDPANGYPATVITDLQMKLAQLKQAPAATQPGRPEPG